MIDNPDKNSGVPLQNWEDLNGTRPKKPRKAKALQESSGDISGLSGPDSTLIKLKTSEKILKISKALGFPEIPEQSPEWMILDLSEKKEEFEKNHKILEDFYQNKDILNKTLHLGPALPCKNSEKNPILRIRAILKLLKINLILAFGTKATLSLAAALDSKNTGTIPENSLKLPVYSIRGSWFEIKEIQEKRNLNLEDLDEPNLLNMTQNMTHMPNLNIQNPQSEENPQNSENTLLQAHRTSQNPLVLVSDQPHTVLCLGQQNDAEGLLHDLRRMERKVKELRVS